MLCIAFASPKRGSLLSSSGMQIDCKMLAKLVGEKDEERIKKLLEELEKNGVFSRLKDGTIISRRMFRERKLSDIRRQAAEKRWGKKKDKKEMQNGYKVDANEVCKTDAKPMQMGEEEVEEEVLSNKEVLVNNKEKILFNFNKERWEGIMEEDIKGWEESYPACHIKLELLQMAQWLLSNPEKRKKRYRRFITNWLSRSQDRGGTRRGMVRKLTKGEMNILSIENWKNRGME